MLPTGFYSTAGSAYLLPLNVFNIFYLLPVRFTQPDAAVKIHGFYFSYVRLNIMSSLVLK